MAAISRIDAKRRSFPQNYKILFIHQNMYNGNLLVQCPFCVFHSSTRLGEHKIPAYVPNVQSYSVD